MQSFDEAGRFGQKLMETGLTSMNAMTNGIQAITTEAGDYARRSCEEGAAAIEAIVSATPGEAARLQADYARSAYEAFVGQASRMSALYADLARDVYSPFETMTRRGS
jgi:hypothetical protein